MKFFLAWALVFAVGGLGASALVTATGAEAGPAVAISLLWGFTAGVVGGFLIDTL